MPKTLFCTEQQVEDEIERLKDSPAVKLALKERYIKERRRQTLYRLWSLEKRGNMLLKNGITPEMMEAAYWPEDDEEDEEENA